MSIWFRAIMLSHSWNHSAQHWQGSAEVCLVSHRPLGWEGPHHRSLLGRQGESLYRVTPSRGPERKPYFKESLEATIDSLLKSWTCDAWGRGVAHLTEEENRNRGWEKSRVEWSTTLVKKPEVADHSVTVILVHPNSCKLVIGKRFETSAAEFWVMSHCPEIHSSVFSGWPGAHCVTQAGPTLMHNPAASAPWELGLQK